MKMMQTLQTWLLITVMALSANTQVSAKVASGGINLGSELHQSLDESKSLNALGISGFSTIDASGSPLAPNGGGKPDFYVGPDGPSSTLPSTAYRYDRYKNDDGSLNEWGQKMLDTNQGQVTYFGFKKYGTGSQARDAFQIKGPNHVNKLDPEDFSWSDARLRGEFDTLQLYENGVPRVRVPREFGDAPGAKPEPFTTAYPEYGSGGVRQLHGDRQVLDFDKVDILPEN